MKHEPNFRSRARSVRLFRGIAGATLAVAACVVSAPLHAQVGAFGGAPSTIDGTGTEALVSAPVVTEGAVFGATGLWSGTLQAGLTTGALEAPGASLDYDVTQIVLAGSYTVSERLVVGATFLPWNRVSLSAGGESISESGRGDASVQARYRTWSAPDGATTMGVAAGVGLPVGAEGFGSEGIVGSLGAAVSRQRDGSSLHGSAGVILPFDDEDGDSVIRITGAGVFGVSARTAVSGELQARFSGGEHIVDLAPGLRFQPAPGVFVEAAVLVNLATSMEQIYDAGFAVALRFGGG
jgi:hypothetical protein